jgi:malonyl CoA-acyl carrier protein transacylase
MFATTMETHNSLSSTRQAIHICKILTEIQGPDSHLMQIQFVLEKATSTVEMVLYIQVQNTVVTGDTETEFQTLYTLYTYG